MGAMKERLAQVLDAFEAWGEADASTGQIPPADDVLWTEARTKDPDLFGEQIDTELLATLRAAFDRGHTTTHIDMSAVVDTVRTAGHHAHIEHTGGGVATIYAGTRDQFPDTHGHSRYAVMAGPGWFPDTLDGRAMADTADFHIGPDDDGQAPTTCPAVGASANDIAALIVAAIAAAEQRRQRIRDAVEAAEQAFWETIFDRFPEVTPAHLTPDAQMPFQQAQHHAVRHLLARNTPVEGIASTQAAAQQIAAARRPAAVGRLTTAIESSGINQDMLLDIVGLALLTEAENIATSAGFTPLGDNHPVRQALKHQIEERFCAAEIDGVRGLAETLHDLLGEKEALVAINRSAPCTWQIDELAGGLYRVALYRDDSMIDRRDTTGEGIGQAKAAMLTDLAHADTH